jgi:hypothetical protein
MKLFELVEKSHYSSGVKRPPRRNPHYTNWLAAVGMTWRDKPRAFTEAEVLKMVVGRSVAKRIPTMREGTLVKLHHLNSTADMYLRRMYEAEILKENAENLYRSQLKAVRASIYASIPQELKDAEKVLVKLLKGETSVIEEDDED